MAPPPSGQDDVMANLPEVPRFGALLRSHIALVPETARPAFLAGLERSAAARYRTWAGEAPEHADVLLACAEREDEIADLVTALFPVDAVLQGRVDDALPAAIERYYEVFAPFGILDQLYLQSEAELQGAQAWVGMSAAADDAGVRDVLARCTRLEEESSAAVKALLAEHGIAVPAPTR
jgi:hypothetical protein